MPVTSSPGPPLPPSPIAGGSAPPPPSPPQVVSGGMGNKSVRERKNEDGTIKQKVCKDDFDLVCTIGEGALTGGRLRGNEDRPPTGVGGSTLKLGGP